MGRGNFKEADIKQALFDVVEKPIFFQSDDGEAFKKLTTHRAIVDVERDNTLAVVTGKYELITNQEAIKRGERIFSQVFDIIKIEDLQCLNIIMPKTRSFCHIDFIHKDSDFSPWEKETWTAFIRVTNSYNRTKPLKYELGFCRWICKNGIIFGAKSIEVKTNHNYGAKEKTERQVENLPDIKALEEEFAQKLICIKDVKFNKELLFPLVIKVFDINADLSTGSFKSKFNKIEKLSKLRLHIDSISVNYVNEYGETAFSAFNTLTDFATRPVSVVSPVGKVNSYQSTCSVWLEEFTSICTKKDFNAELYLAPELESIKSFDTVLRELT